MYPKDSNYLDLLFQDIKSIKNIAVLLNGNMRTPKIEALHRLIDWLNAWTTDGFKIYNLGLDNSWLGSNPWLSGFIESDGKFYCEFNLKSEEIATIIKGYMRVSPKQSYKSTTTISKINEIFYKMVWGKGLLDVKNVTEIQRNKPNYMELN